MGVFFTGHGVYVWLHLTMQRLTNEYDDDYDDDNDDDDVMLRR